MLCGVGGMPGRFTDQSRPAAKRPGRTAERGPVAAPRLELGVRITSAARAALHRVDDPARPRISRPHTGLVYLDIGRTCPPRICTTAELEDRTAPRHRHRAHPPAPARPPLPPT